MENMKKEKQMNQKLMIELKEMKLINVTVLVIIYWLFGKEISYLL